MNARAWFAASLAAVVLTTFALVAGAPRGLAAMGVPIDPIVNCNVTKPSTPITPTLLASGLPCAATIDTPSTVDPTASIQHDFDYYSWLTFLAINAPASGGVIGTGKGPGGDAPTIWEGYQDLDNLIPPNGGTPPPWGHQAPPPPACRAIGAQTTSQIIQMIAKLPNLSATNQPFADGPLIDQSGHYTRYQIYVNRPMYEYIVQNHLYNKTGQGAFTGTIDFPEGQVFKDSSKGTVGAVMIKAAWKIFDGNDSPKNFHTMVAYVYTPPNPKEHIKESCLRQRVALVGIHIVHKTKNDPEWIWSTFEQVANDPEQSQLGKGHLLPHYNYFNPACATCKVNAKPPQPWNPNVQPFPNGFRSQIALVIGLTPEVRAMNERFQSILRGTVWQNYKLISTQWPTNPRSPVDPTGSPAPIYLANTTMETYVQGEIPGASSCILCHNNAADTQSKASDFTFVLSRAH